MNICICGWYFRPSFMQAIAASVYPAFVVRHRDGDTQGIPFTDHENRGLEFGAYREYVQHHWDGESDVLFLHDDTEVRDLTALREISTLREMGVEQAYIFPDETHEHVNGGAHGRGIWIRADILKMLANDFPADMSNEGVNIGLAAQKGILKFHERIMQCGKNTGVIAIVPGIEFAHRGRIHETMFVYRRASMQVPGELVNVH